MQIEEHNLLGIGARLLIERSELGLSQSEMAIAIGVSPRAYHAYEKGKRGIPVEALISMAEQFEIDMNWILRGIRSTNPTQDVDKLENFIIELDDCLDAMDVKLKSAKRAAIIGKWYKSYLTGKELPMADVQVWLDLLKE